VEIRVRHSAGGIGPAQTELRAYVRALAKGLRPASMPDLLCVAIAANCHGHARRRRELERHIDPTIVPHTVFLCPDPHVERWYLADPSAFARVVGGGTGYVPHKCERSTYKRLFREAVRAAGQEPSLDGTEYGTELVECMDLYQAGKAVPSLGAAVEDLKRAFQVLRRRS
jgi:hypothetical protein